MIGSSSSNMFVGIERNNKTEQSVVVSHMRLVNLSESKEGWNYFPCMDPERCHEGT